MIFPTIAHNNVCCYFKQMQKYSQLKFEKKRAKPVINRPDNKIFLMIFFKNVKEIILNFVQMFREFRAVTCPRDTLYVLYTVTFI